MLESFRFHGHPPLDQIADDPRYLGADGRVRFPIPYKDALDLIEKRLKPMRDAQTAGLYVLLAVKNNRVLCHQTPNHNAFELHEPTPAFEGLRFCRFVTQPEAAKIIRRWNDSLTQEQREAGDEVREFRLSSVLEDQFYTTKQNYIYAAEQTQNDHTLD